MNILIRTLREVIEHTNNKFNLDAIQIMGKQGAVVFSCVDAVDKSIVFEATAKHILKELDGKNGLDRLQNLSGMLEIYTDEKDTLTLTRKNVQIRTPILEDDGSEKLDEKGEVICKEETKSVLEQGDLYSPTKCMANSFRFMDRRVIPEQFNLNAIEADVVVPVSQKIIDCVSAQNKIGWERYISAITREQHGSNNLLFTLGQLRQAWFLIDENVVGTIDNKWCWDIQQLNRYLKFAQKAKNGQIELYNAGVLIVRFETELLKFQIVFPGKSGL